MAVVKADLGFTPHKFQCQARTVLEIARFVVLVCHRRWGKTVFAVMELILAATSSKRSDFKGAYIAPFRKQAKDVAWDYFKRFAGKIPGVIFNETELTITFPNGARITLYGTDNAEAMRGLYFDYVVMDEVADMKPHVWHEIIRYTLMDRGGRCLFIGTPKGMNLFFEFYNRGVSGQDGWKALMFRASDTVGELPWISQEELEMARKDSGEAQYRQEMECDFDASCDNNLITLDLLKAARGKHIEESVFMRFPLVFGVDVARYGSDSCVIQPRRGPAAFIAEEHTKIDNITFAQKIHRRIVAERPQAVFIDAGGGSGVIDYLRSIQSPSTIVEVAFGSSAHNSGDNGYYNKRAEMWDEMRKWLATGAIPDNYKLVRELAAPTYTMDSRGRMKMEKKEDIISRLGYSPDRADALALTFAEPVMIDDDFGYADIFVGGPQQYAKDELILV